METLAKFIAGANMYMLEHIWMECIVPPYKNFAEFPVSGIMD